GLGLSTVADILRQHRGGLVLDSQPGRGTYAAAYLALADREGCPAPADRQPELLEAGTETVLLVEDEPAFREMLRLGLTRTGYGVVEAASAEQALRLLDGSGASAV